MNKVVLPLLFLALSPLNANPVKAQLSSSDTFNSPGRYEIQSVESDLLLDVAAEDHASVQQYPRRGRPNQQWDVEPADDGYFVIREVEQGMLLSLSAKSGSRGAAAVVAPPDRSDRQLWRIVPTQYPGEFQLVSRSGMVLDVAEKSHEKGGRLQGWASTGAENQRFRFILIHSSRPWSGRDDRYSRDSSNYPQPGGDAKRACTDMVQSTIADTRAFDISADVVSTDSSGVAVVVWKTARGSSGFCRVDRTNRVLEFKVEQSSR